jgi:hypothetical protein
MSVLGMRNPDRGDAIEGACALMRQRARVES